MYFCTINENKEKECYPGRQKRSRKILRRLKEIFRIKRIEIE
jgi:hypothetical protein